MMAEGSLSVCFCVTLSQSIDRNAKADEEDDDRSCENSGGGQ